MTEPNSARIQILLAGVVVEMVSQEAKDTDCALEGSGWVLGKKLPHGEGVQPWDGSPERLGNLHPWRHFKNLLDKAAADPI